jgi:chromosome segregation ATPase
MLARVVDDATFESMNKNSFSSFSFSSSSSSSSSSPTASAIARRRKERADRIRNPKKNELANKTFADLLAEAANEDSDNSDSETCPLHLSNAMSALLTLEADESGADGNLSRALHARVEQSVDLMRRLIAAFEKQRSDAVSADERVRRAERAADQLLVHNGELGAELTRIDAENERLLARFAEMDAELLTAQRERQLAERRVAKLEIELATEHRRAEAGGAAPAAVTAAAASTSTTTSNGSELRPPPKKQRTMAAAAVLDDDDSDDSGNNQVSKLRVELEDAIVSYQKRGEMIEELKERNGELRAQLAQAKELDAIASDQKVVDSPLYRTVLEQWRRASEDLGAEKTRVAKLQEQLSATFAQANGERSSLLSDHGARAKAFEAELAQSCELAQQLKVERDELAEQLSERAPGIGHVQQLLAVVVEQKRQLARMKRELDEARGAAAPLGADERDQMLSGELDELAHEFETLSDSYAKLLEQQQQEANAGQTLMAERLAWAKREAARGEHIRLQEQKIAQLGKHAGAQQELAGAQRAEIAALQAQLSSLPSEIAMLRSIVGLRESALRERDSDIAALTQRTRGLETRIAAYKRRVLEDPSRMERQSVKIKQLEDECASLERKLERYGSQKQYHFLEAALREAESAVRCPICNDATRDTAITKCGHVFCSSCVQKRISGRDRKCPGCSRPFSKGDVLSIWLTT